MRGFKTTNEYAEYFGALYARTPKAVFAAVLASFLSDGGDHPENIAGRFREEWRILHNEGIVPQPVPTAKKGV